MVAVYNPKLHAGGGGVCGLVLNLDTPESVTHKVACKLVVVAWHINHTATFACSAQQFLDHIVVALRPEPASAQLPAIHNVTHQIQHIAGVVFQKIQQSFGLKAWCANVQV